MKDNIFKNNVRIISSISILGISILNCNASNLTSKENEFSFKWIIKRASKKYNNCIDKIENTNVITSINSIKEKGINTDLILNNDHNNSIKNKKQDPESEAYKSFLQEAYKRYENGCIIIAVFDKNQNEHVNEIENNFKNQLKSRNITNFSDYFHSEEKVIDIYNELKEYTDNIVVCDPLANIDAVRREYGIEIVNEIPEGEFDGVLLAVNHKEFKDIENITLSLKELWQSMK